MWRNGTCEGERIKGVRSWHLQEAEAEMLKFWTQESDELVKRQETEAQKMYSRLAKDVWD